MEALTQFDVNEKQIILPVETARERIELWMRAHDLWHDCHFYSGEEWKARGEPFGNNDDFTMTCEGDFVHYSGTEVEERFYEFARSLGYFCEQGYAWSWHFMNLEKFDAATPNQPKPN